MTELPSIHMHMNNICPYNAKQIVFKNTVFGFWLFSLVGIWYYFDNNVILICWQS